MIVAAFLLCNGSEFQTDDPEGERAQSPFVLYLYNGSFRRRVSALERRVREGKQRYQDIREISGSGGIDGTETEAGNFVRDTSLDR